MVKSFIFGVELPVCLILQPLQLSLPPSLTYISISADDDDDDDDDHDDGNAVPAAATAANNFTITPKKIKNNNNNNKDGRFIRSHLPYC